MNHLVDQAWEVLAKKSINNNDPVCYHEGECWQYMGSPHEKEKFTFRHRCHPITNQREHIHILKDELQSIVN